MDAEELVAKVELDMVPLDMAVVEKTMLPMVVLLAGLSSTSIK